jgi:hypothetical protein
MLGRALTTPNRMHIQYLNLIEVLLEQRLADSAQVVQQAVADGYSLALPRGATP